MKIIKRDQISKIDITDRPLFLGGKVIREPIVGDDLSSTYTFAIVDFAAGARNKLHTHTCDQILFATKGKGIVATESEEHSVSVGAIIHVPAGEKHWHGAGPDSSFSHIALTSVDSKTEQLEP